MKAGERVTLSAEARSRFPDIGIRVGTIEAIDGWIVVKFTGLPMSIRVPESDLVAV